MSQTEQNNYCLQNYIYVYCTYYIYNTYIYIFDIQWVYLYFLSAVHVDSIEFVVHFKTHNKLKIIFYVLIKLVENMVKLLCK